MVLVSLSLVIIAIIVFFLLIMKDIGNSEYNVKDSEISKQAEEKYLAEFSDYTDEKVKEELGTITNLLIENQPSNRYTELLREKAKKDEKIEQVKEAFLDDVDIVKYEKGTMKAKVKYRDLNTIYSIVLTLSTVTKGRLFLNDYFVYEEAVKVDE